MKLIVGLGNPGKEYTNTRHNIGFMLLDEFAKVNKINIDKKKFNGLYNQFMFNNEKIILLKPQMYMNLSGIVIKKFIDYFKINIEDILIIYDDMSFETGILKFKLQGTSGGHNGLKNIEENLKTTKYKRLKIGISKNQNTNPKNYVLGSFNNEEIEQLNNILKNIDTILKDFMITSFEKLMSKYNKSKI